jgi:hypothetical protein
MSLLQLDHAQSPRRKLRRLGRRLPFAQRLTCTVAEACEVTGLGLSRLKQGFDSPWERHAAECSRFCDRLRRHTMTVQSGRTATQTFARSARRQAKVRHN